MDGKIRIDNGSKRIEVNDNGDYIILPMGDRSFPARYFKMVSNMNAALDAAAVEAEKLDAEYEGRTDTPEYQVALREFECETYGTVIKEIDNLFGEDTCKKVFGDIVPEIDLYFDFLNQLKPYFEAHAATRAEKMQKYSAERLGNA